MGIGSSAGGLEALTAFFNAMPPDGDMAFVIVQHLAPTHESLMAELLARCTAMPVVQVRADTVVEPNHVYCIPPGRYLGITGATLRLSAPIETSVRMPIDFFFRSLAAAAQERAIGVVLSGTGSDGTLGLRAIKGAGGLALAQSPATSQHDGMPRSAIAAGAVDHVAATDLLPGLLLEYVRHPYARRGMVPAAPASPDDDRLDDVVAVLRERTRFDFGSYKRSTLGRRIGRRMGLTHVERHDDYLRLLQTDESEAMRLFDDLLISVTSFFRDAGAWTFLQRDVIRPLVARKDSATAIRVWVPACATGEEAYSIAMLVIEALQAARKRCPVEIFASDVDVGALAFARAGLYPESILADVSPERRRRFFVEEGPGYRVTDELRAAVVFARQNLLCDPPFSRLDLVSCRNVLMYLDPDAQQKVLALMHFALVDGGHLFLGSAETVARQEDLFEVVSKKWRIYRRVGPTRHDRVEFPSRRDAVDRPSTAAPARSGLSRLGQLAQQRLLEHFVPACVLVDRRLDIQYYAGPTRDYLSQPSGIPTHGLLSCLREGLHAPVRSAVRKAAADGQRVVVRHAHVRRDDRWCDVRITVDLFGGTQETDGLLLITFTDDTPEAAPATAGSDATSAHDAPAVRQLERELKATREDLQTTIQDVESSNQDLRVANEEIMSVNEELRSTNEELETSKEELQSLNEELNTVNTQLEDKVLQLERANNDLDNLLTGTNIATIFLDARMRVRRFTPAATELFNLIPADVGRPIADIAQRCTDPELLLHAEAVLVDPRPINREVQTADGRWFVRQVLPYRTREHGVDGVVITFSDVAAEALREARLYAEAIVDTIREPLLVLDADLRVQSTNRAFDDMFPPPADPRARRSGHESDTGLLGLPRLRELLGQMLLQQGVLEDFELEQTLPGKGRRLLLLNGRTLKRQGRRPDLILLAIEDITERRLAEQALRESEAMTRAGVHTAVDGVLTLDGHGTVLSFNPAAEHIFGYTSDEVIGHDVGVILPPDDGGGPRPLPAEQVGVAREVRGRRKDGTTFPCDLHLSAFGDAADRRYVATLRDVTDRKRTEEQVRRQQAELAHVLRVATIERLAAGLAHELNQPLTAIANEIEACATYVRSGKGGRRKLLALLERAGSGALRAGEIVHHLRDFVKRTAPHLEPTDLSDLIRSATRWLEPEIAQERIALRFDLAPQPLLVRVDRVQVEQVLMNLLQNAVDALRGTESPTRAITIRTTARDHRWAELTVDDTGVGLDASARERLYEPFFTTKAQGLGMGLAISRGILEMHHGELSVAPAASGVGTTVRVRLPLGDSR